jgi:hypothetical protein
MNTFVELNETQWKFMYKFCPLHLIRPLLVNECSPNFLRSDSACEVCRRCFNSYPFQMFAKYGKNEYLKQKKSSTEVNVNVNVND